MLQRFKKKERRQLRGASSREVALIQSNYPLAKKLSKTFKLSLKKTVALLLAISGLVHQWIIVPYLNQITQEGVVDPTIEIATITTNSAATIVRKFSNLLKNNPQRLATCAALLSAEQDKGAAVQGILRDLEKIGMDMGQQSKRELEKLSLRLTVTVWDDIVMPLAMKYLPATIVNNSTSRALSLTGVSKNRSQLLIKQSVREMNKALARVGKSAVINRDGTEIRVVDMDIRDPIIPSSLQQAGSRAACAIFSRTGYPPGRYERDCLDLEGPATFQNRCPRLYEDVNRIAQEVTADTVAAGVREINRAVDNVHRTHRRVGHDAGLQISVIGVIALLFFLFYFLYATITENLCSATKRRRRRGSFSFGRRKSRRKSRRRKSTRRKSRRRKSKSRRKSRRRKSTRRKSRRRKSTRRKSTRRKSTRRKSRRKSKSRRRKSRRRKSTRRKSRRKSTRRKSRRRKSTRRKSRRKSKSRRRKSTSRRGSR
jgi:hypothetical protein